MFIYIVEMVGLSLQRYYFIPRKLGRAVALVASVLHLLVTNLGRSVLIIQICFVVLLGHFMHTPLQSLKLSQRAFFSLRIRALFTVISQFDVVQSELTIGFGE